MLQAIANASWANVWAAISAISTLSTLIVAIIAMRVWKSQEKLKAKQAFKSSIAEYAWCLAMMPEDLKVTPTDELANQMVESVNRLYNCRHAWLATEGLLNNNKAVSQSWEFIRTKHGDYMNGKITNKDLIEKTKVILAEKFVF
ncbi:hypothetical protein [Enterobacter vonholyi]|uniref:hypothetical protein n=1 Tax=Enterobacter vonholyi TaxID=2797505 RepID=UPI0026653FDB|nr:hypothetical protein [Enterobacter vonholyi]MDO2449760.1 hypothetical protein [Enterobacter vonholyi]